MTAAAKYRFPTDFSTPGQVSHTYYVRGKTAAEGRRKVVETWSESGLLGVGGYGSVRLEQRTQGGGIFDKRAVKVLDKSFTNGQQREIDALVRLVQLDREQRDAFVRFYGWFENAGSIYIAMEYYPLGDFSRYISKLKPDDARMIAAQILKGTKVIHEILGIAHRDLKPQNLLVQQSAPKWVVKIADFGLAKNEFLLVTGERGTPRYMAPEILQNTPYTSAVDMWSLGCIIYEMLFSKTPFDPRYPHVLADYCITQKLPLGPSGGKVVSPEALKLVESLLHPKADLRPSAASALKSSDWLQGDNYTDFSSSNGYDTASSAGSHGIPSVTQRSITPITEVSSRASIYNSAGTGVEAQNRTKPQTRAEPQNRALDEASDLIAQGSRLVPRLLCSRATAEARSAEARQLFTRAITRLESISSPDPQTKLGKYRRLTYISLELTYVTRIEDHAQYVYDAKTYNRAAERATDQIGDASPAGRRDARNARTKVELDRARICLRHGRIKQKQALRSRYAPNDVDSRSASDLLMEAFRIYEVLAAQYEADCACAADFDLRAQALQGCGEAAQMLPKTASGGQILARNALEQPGTYFNRALGSLKEGMGLSSCPSDMVGALQHTASCIKAVWSQSGVDRDSAG